MISGVSTILGSCARKARSVKPETGILAWRRALPSLRERLEDPVIIFVRVIHKTLTIC